MEQLAAQEIGARIRQARKELGLTQDELAEMTTFSKRSLQDYETGVTIPYRQFREISSLLRRPVEWFLHGHESASRDERLDRMEGLLVEVLGELRERRHDDADDEARAEER